MAQKTYIARKGADADFATLSVTSLVVGGETYATTEVTLADDALITLGDGNDVVLEWDTAATPDQLQFRPAADDTVISFGAAAATQKSFDLIWYGNEANGASSLTFDASANLIYTTGVDLQFKDNDYLVFGSGAGATGDVTIRWDATDLDMAATGASAAFNIGAADHVINTTFTGTVTVGVDDTGYDVKFFGATAGKSLLWDESADKLIITGDLAVTGAIALTGATTQIGALTVGVDGTGHDVQLFGDTAGCSLLWDQSEDQLVITGPADVPALKIAGAGSKSAAAYAATGAAWADGAAPAFVDDQAYMLIDIAGTVYRIPLFANA